MSNEKDEDLEVINLDEYEEDYDEEEDYDDDEYEDEEDYDYDDLALAEDDSDSNFIFKEKDSENDEKWGFQDEEYYDDEEDEYEDEYDEYDEDYDDEDEDDEDVEYIDDDFIEEPEYDYEEPLDPQEIAPTKPVAATEDNSGVNDGNANSKPLKRDTGDNSNEEDSKESDGEPIFEKLFGAIKDKNISIDLSFYDKAMSTVLTKLSALPVVGKLFALFTKSKNVLRLFPLILIVLIYGICFVFSMIIGVDKTSTVELPDSGEVTLTTVDFYKDTNNIIFEAENTGGVINPFEVEEMKLYTYSPGLNPLSWAKFKEIGTCSLPENSVEDIAELSGKCELKEDEKAAFNTRAVIESKE